MRVLVVDDEPAIRQMITRSLMTHGIQADASDSGAAALEQCGRAGYDVVVLDVVMPERSGTEVLPDLLARCPGQSVVMLSALSDPRTKVQCLERGAVDYMTKPFSLAELVARLRTHARRGASLVPLQRQPERRRAERRQRDRRAGDRAASASGPEQPTDRWLRTATASLDLLGRQVHIADRVISLTERETLLLACLLRRPGEACTRAELLEAVWQDAEQQTTNALEVLVGRVRAKIGFERVSTVRGVGYAYVPA